MDNTPYKTKEERKAIYEKLLSEVDTPITHPVNVGTYYFICWKLAKELEGDRWPIAYDSTLFDTDIQKKFPEFAESFLPYHCDSLEHRQRPIVLRKAIELCNHQNKSI